MQANQLESMQHQIKLTSLHLCTCIKSSSKFWTQETWLKIEAWYVIMTLISQEFQILEDVSKNSFCMSLDSLFSDCLRHWVADHIKLWRKRDALINAVKKIMFVIRFEKILYSSRITLEGPFTYNTLSLPLSFITLSLYSTLDT